MRTTTATRAMTRRFATVLLAAAAALAAASGAWANDLFAVKVSVTDPDGRVRTIDRGFADAEEALRVVEGKTLEQFFPGYDGATHDVHADVNFRGLPIEVDFSGAAGGAGGEDAKTLVFQVESLGVEEEFAGETRDESIDKFVDFLEGDGGEVLNRIQRELAAVSPVDPIAGNPGSLQSAIVRDAFAGGAFDTMPAGAGWGVGAAAEGVSFTAGDYSGQGAVLPLSYTFTFDDAPGAGLRIGLPLSWRDVEGAAIYTVSPTLAWTQPLDEGWSVTPAAAWGIAGSIDAASAGQMIGAAVTSRYAFPGLDLTGVKLTMGNMVAHLRTLGFKIEDYEFEPGIANTVLKNGLAFEGDAGMALFDGAGLAYRLSWAHSYFAGTELYMNQYHEFAVSLGSMDADAGEELRLGASYVFGDDYREIGVRLRWAF